MAICETTPVFVLYPMDSNRFHMECQGWNFLDICSDFLKWWPKLKSAWEKSVEDHVPLRFKARVKTDPKGKWVLVREKAGSLPFNLLGVEFLIQNGWDEKCYPADDTAYVKGFHERSLEAILPEICKATPVGDWNRVRITLLRVKDET